MGKLEKTRKHTASYSEPITNNSWGFAFPELPNCGLQFALDTHVQSDDAYQQ